MEVKYLLEGLLIGILVSIPVGPVGIYIVVKSITKGRIPGFLSGLGAVTADMIYSVVAAASMSLIISFVEEEQVLFQVIGGIVVLIIGFKVFNDNPVKNIRNPVKSKGKRFVDDYATVILMVLANPINLLLYVGIFASLQYPVHGSFMAGPGLTILGIIISATIWWFMISYYLSKFSRRIRLRKILWFNKIAGLGIIVFGIFVLGSTLYIMVFPA